MSVVMSKAMTVITLVQYVSGTVVMVKSPNCADVPLRIWAHILETS